MSIIQDGTGKVSIETGDFPLLSPDTIRKVLSDLTARPWRDPMPLAERAGSTGPVYCTTGPAAGSYRADRWRAVDRDLSSSTSWGYRYFDEKPVIGSKCYDRGAVLAAVRAQSAENRARAEQFVALTSLVARLWRGADQQAGNALMGVTLGATAPAERPAGYGGVTGRQTLQSPAARAKLATLQRKLSSTPQGQRWARRLEGSDLRADFSAKLRETLAKSAGIPVDAVDPAAVAAVVDSAAVDQAEELATGGGGVSAEWQALLDTVYPLASAERYAELFPALPLEVQNLIAQYSQTFQAVGLE